MKVFRFNECNKFFGDFIVKSEELGVEPAAFQVIMAMFESLEEFRC